MLAATSLRTAATRVTAPALPVTQLCGAWKMMSSWRGYPLPLLSYVLSLTVTVKDEMPDAAGMVAEMGKKANVSSKP